MHSTATTQNITINQNVNKNMQNISNINNMPYNTGNIYPNSNVYNTDHIPPAPGNSFASDYLPSPTHEIKAQKQNNHMSYDRNNWPGNIEGGSAFSKTRVCQTKLNNDPLLNNPYLPTLKEQLSKRGLPENMTVEDKKESTNKKLKIPKTVKQQVNMDMVDMNVNYRFPVDLPNRDSVS